jgi:hypothetical protein
VFRESFQGKAIHTESRSSFAKGPAGREPGRRKSIAHSKTIGGQHAWNVSRLHV